MIALNNVTVLYICQDDVTSVTNDYVFSLMIFMSNIFYQNKNLK